MQVGIGLVVLAGLVAIAELGRLAVAKLFGYQAERHAIPIMKLPGTRGTTGFRLALILAGPVTGYLAIAVLAFTLFKCHGTASDQLPTKITSLVSGSDASEKLRADDRILEVDGARFDGGALNLSEQVNQKGGTPVTLTILRDETTQHVAVTPRQDPEGGKWRLGVILSPDLDRSFGVAARNAIVYPALQARITIKGFIDLFRGDNDVDVGGPTRLVIEVRHVFSDPSAVGIMRIGMVLGTWCLLALALFDLVRALLLILFRS